MFRLCVGDEAPGSSQTAFGFASPLQAPLSNFRAWTLPTTVSLPHSHKPETDSLPACLGACPPSPSLSDFPSLPVVVSFYLSLFFCLLSQTFSVDLGLSFPKFALFLHVWFRALGITALQSHWQYLNHVTLPLSLVSGFTPASVCISIAPSTSPLIGCKCPFHVFRLIAPLSPSRGTHFFAYGFYCLGPISELLWVAPLIYFHTDQFITSSKVWAYFSRFWLGHEAGVWVL